MRFLILLFLAYLLYRLIRGLFRSRSRLTKTRNDGVIDEMVQDPVCKTYIPLRDARQKVIRGRKLYFCSRECADKFREEMKA